MRATLLGSSVVLAGCVSTVVAAGGAPNRYQNFAAGYLGCRASDIAITEHVADSSGSASWVATCQGVSVVCGGATSSSVHCAEMRQAPTR